MERIVPIDHVQTGNVEVLVAVRVRSSRRVEMFTYVAGPGETANELIVRAVGNVDFGDIMGIQVNRQVVIHTLEQQSLVDQTLAVL